MRLLAILGLMAVLVLGMLFVSEKAENQHTYKELIQSEKK